MKDYYEILGLPRSAGPEAIAKAKDRLAHLYHPDTRPKDLDPSYADKRILDILDAWQTLSDPAQRAAYDRATAAGALELPQLAVGPNVVELFGVDSAGVATFSVEVTQVGGPPYDPALHELEISWGSPWDRTVLGYDAGGRTAPPLTLTFEMDLRAAGFTPRSDYFGDFVVAAVAKG